MRNFLLILIFFTNFLSLSKADNIKEFAIEGISIGDSLLDYTSAKKIKDGMLTDYKSNLYSRFTLRDINSKSFKLYDDIQIHFKTNDKNFIIVSMSGGIYNDNEFEKCLETKEQAIKDISKILPDAIGVDGGTSPWLEVDMSGKTITSAYYFNLGSGKYNDYIEIACYDWNEKLNSSLGGSDHFKIAAHAKKFDKWLSEDAF